MRKKRNAGKWTEGRYSQFVRSALRAAFRKWPPKFEVLRNAYTERKLNKKSGKMAKHYRCASCNKDFPLTEVQVDHIQPVVPRNFTTWDSFIERLYVEAKKLQVLCKPCHKTKTKVERAAREG